MKLIFIYGPPASGKLTVATELSKMTGFRLFHNHVSIQFVTSLFDFGTETFHVFLDKYRREMIEEAARKNINLIFTFVYGAPEDNEFVRDIVRRVKKHNGKVHFVRLTCTRKELAKRVSKRSRRVWGKLTEKKTLDELFRSHDLDSEIPAIDSLSVDSTMTSPRTVARMIAEHCKIPMTKKAGYGA